MRTTTLLALTLCLSALGKASAAEPSGEHKLTYFEKVKITVDERAHADGYITVSVRPENGAPREATADLHKRESENDIAKSIARALEPVLGPEYTVDRDAGEHVKIRKAKRDAPNFAVAITFTSPGFAIILDAD